MNSLRITFFAALLAFANAQCGAGLSSCNGQCYSTQYNSCPTDPTTSKQVLCPLNYAACNGACYSPSQYHCANGGLQAGAAVNTPTPTSSSTVAVNPTTSAQPATPSTGASQQTCNSAGCGAGTCSCNGQCYSPSQYSCPLDPVTSKNYLCWGNSGACNGQCYDTTQYSCKNGGLVQGGTPQPTSQQVATSSAAPTPSTYAPPTTASQQTCNSAGCGAGACSCNGQCYSPSQYSCPFDAVTSKNYLCWGNSGACNGQCYDTTQYSCRNGGLVQGGQAATQTPAPSSTVQRSSSTPVSTTSTPAPVVNPNPVANQYPTQTADLRIINSCKTTLWFEARYGNQGAPLPGATTTATIALPGSYVDYTIPATGLSGSRFWAKYGCDSKGKNCMVGDQMQYWPNPPGGCPTNGCTPPVDSLFEATWGCRPGTGCNSQNPTTWFDTSQVDGWTIPYKLSPNGDTSGCDCIGTSCGFKGVDASKLDLARCPRGENLVAGGQSTVNVNGQAVSLSSVDLRIINNGSVIGCLSPCKRMNWGAPFGLGQPEDSGSAMWMCCPTPTPDNCSPSNGCILPQACRNGPIESTQFVQAVHDMAPGIYSFSYDDGVGLHACPAGVVTYTMEFCPAGSAAYPSPL